MGTRRIEQGPTAQRVAQNIKQIREDRRLSLEDVSRRVADLGRPMLVSGLWKIEAGERRADADDLVALALALDTTPNRLLLAADASRQRIGLTPKSEATTATAWRWATGEDALPDAWGDRRTLDAERLERFKRENRPFEREPMKPAEMARHEDVARLATQTAYLAHERGLDVSDVCEFMRGVDLFRRVGEQARALERKTTKKTTKKTTTRKAKR
jgi:transcriptional regulator with XRE-family HTH domain